MTFLRLGISSFFIIAPAIAYFSGMSPTIVVGLLVIALWGLISAAGEGALGLHHVDAYGPLSPYNDGSDGELTKTGKISAGIVAFLGAVLLFFAASSYIKNKNKPPAPSPTSSPVVSPTETPGTDAQPESTPAPVAVKTPAPVATPKASETPVASETPKANSTPAPAASAGPEDLEFEKLKLKAEEKVLSRDYSGATAMLEDLEKKAPNDAEVLFFRFLAFQGLDEDVKAKEYCERILKDHPGSRYERRLNKFLKALELAERRKKLGGHSSSTFAIEKGASIELIENALLAQANDRNLDEVTGAQIGLELISPEPEVKPLNLKAGSKVTPMKSVHFFLKINSGDFAWEKSRNTAGAAEVDLVFVKVTSGKQKGKQGWIINNLKGAPSSEDHPSRNARNVLGLTVIR